MEARHGIVAVALIGGLALAAPALAAGKGRLIQKQTRSTNQIENQERHRDGSSSQTGTPLGAKNKRGNTYGPGDGSGYQGRAPKDGTGYGAPTNR